MADMTLHGNGENCPACELRRGPQRSDRAMNQSVECNFCGGSGRVGRAVADIIREAVVWAKEHYWPEREKAYAKHNEASDARSAA